MSDDDPNAVQKTSEKDAARVRIFPPGAPLVTIILGTMLQKIWPIAAELSISPAVRYGLGGGIIILSLYFLGFRAVADMRKSGQSENPYKKTTEILEDGPYRFTRNPMYLMMVLLCVGFGIFSPNIWLLVLSPFCALALHFLVILPEEAYLERKFGATYLAYKARVRRWI